MNTKALFNLGYGLYILTVTTPEKNHGCVVNTVMQITSTPLQVLLGVNKGNATHDALAENKVCNISVLDTTTPFSIFEQFGFQSGRLVDKFANAQQFQTSANGLPYLAEHTNAYLSGKVTAMVDYGTHTLFTLEITDGQVLADTASLTYADYHRDVKPKAQPKAKGYRCLICGYLHEEAELPADFICPICKHGATDFEEVK